MKTKKAKLNIGPKEHRVPSYGDPHGKPTGKPAPSLPDSTMGDDVEKFKSEFNDIKSSLHDMIDEIEKGRCWEGYKPVKGKKPYSEGSCVKKNDEAEKSEKPFEGYNKNRHSPTGGLNSKFREKYNREHGSHLQAPVTEKNPTGKRAGRKRSFCARMSGVKGPTSKDGKLTPKGAALKRWRCSKSIEEKDMKIRKPDFTDMRKSLYNMIEDIQKSSEGEGSRGGKVIGHTKSGKPIYESASSGKGTAEYQHHMKFTPQEHREARDLKEKMGDKAGAHSHNLHAEEGKVVGHTKSGKAIHSTHHPSHKNFNHDEHDEARDLQTKLGNHDMADYHNNPSRGIHGNYSHDPSKNVTDEQKKESENKRKQEWEKEKNSPKHIAEMKKLEAELKGREAREKEARKNKPFRKIKNNKDFHI